MLSVNALFVYVSGSKAKLFGGAVFWNMSSWSFLYCMDFTSQLIWQYHSLINWLCDWVSVCPISTHSSRATAAGTHLCSRDLVFIWLMPAEANTCTWNKKHLVVSLLPTVIHCNEEKPQVFFIANTYKSISCITDMIHYIIYIIYNFWCILFFNSRRIQGGWHLHCFYMILLGLLWRQLIQNITNHNM